MLKNGVVQEGQNNSPPNTEVTEKPGFKQRVYGEMCITSLTRGAAVS